MDPQEQAAWEEYQRQQEEAAWRTYQGQSAPFAKPPEQLGPDYTQSVGANALRGIEQSPAAGWQFGSDLIDVFSPYNTSGEWQWPILSSVARNAPETTAKVVGSLAAGTAGAVPGAQIGGGWGLTLGPWGGLAGSVLGGAAGFGAGLLGFDVAKDVAKTAVSGEDYIRPTDQYVKDFVYNTVQGVPFGMAGKAAASIPKRIVKPFTQATAEARAAAALEQLEPGYGERVSSALAEGVSDPFIQYKSLGELLDSDILKNAQRTIARSSPEGYGQSAEAYRARNDAQLKYLSEIEQTPPGETPVTMADVQESIRTGQEGKLAAGQRGLTAAEEAARTAIDELPPSIDLSEAGKQIRAGVEAGRGALDQRIQTAFEGAGTGKVAPVNAKQTADALMPQYFKEVGAQPSGELLKLVEDLNRQAELPTSPTGEPVKLFGADNQLLPPKPAEYTIQDVQALRSKALQIGTKGDRRSATIANQIAEALKKDIDSAVETGSVTPQEAASLKKGIELRKEKGVDFESVATPAKRVLGNQAYGEAKLSDSAVPSEYFKPGAKGAKERIDNLKKTFGATDEALEPLYRYATDSFRHNAMENGVVNTKKASRWLRDHAATLDQLPGLKKQLSNAHEAQQFVNEKLGVLKQTQAEIEKGALRYILNADPDKAISAMLSGRDMIKRTNSTVQYLKANDPEALAGLRRGVIEHLKQKTYIPDAKVSLEEASIPGGPQFEGTVRGGLLKLEWEKIRPAIERSKLFNESQLKGLDYLYRDKASQLSVEKAKMPAGSDTYQNFSTGAALWKLAGTGFLRNFPVTRYITSIISPVLKAIPQAKFEAIFEEALLNPRIARDLANKATAKNVVKSVREIFAEEFTPPEAAMMGAGAIAKYGVPIESQKERKLQVPKQQQVTSKESFPTPNKLLNPPAPGKLSAETRARITVESGGNPRAVSSKGAQGLSQLMPDTAQEIALKLGETYMPLRLGMTPEEEQASIDQNIRFGDYYYKQQLKRFKKPSLAWAAYNAGPERIEDAMKLAGTSTDVNKILAALPKDVQKETIPYVDKVSALAAKYGRG